MNAYPKLNMESPQEVAIFLRKIRELRDTDIIEFNGLLSLAGYQQGFRKSTRTVADDANIAITDLGVDMDATAGNLTATLEELPTDGTEHTISKSDSSGNTVTVDGNGKDINGSSSVVLSAQYDSISIRYMGGSGEWRIIAQI